MGFWTWFWEQRKSPMTEWIVGILTLCCGGVVTGVLVLFGSWWFPLSAVVAASGILAMMHSWYRGFGGDR